MSEIAGLYDRAAGSYGRVGPSFFEFAGRRLVELVGISAGQRVLDVGTGRGAALFPAASRVGPTGAVLGIDVSAGMVAETARDVRQRGLRHVDVRQMDALALALADGSFDRVVSSFASQFFSPFERALAEFHRVLRPGGVLGLANSGPLDERWRPQNDLYGEYQRAGLLSLETPPPGAPREPERLAAALAAAGFGDVRLTEEETELVYADEEEWWASQWTHGARRPLEQMQPEVLARFKEESFARIRGFKRADGLPYLLRLAFVTGVKTALRDVQTARLR